MTLDNIVAIMTYITLLIILGIVVVFDTIICLYAYVIARDVA